MESKPLDPKLLPLGHLLDGWFLSFFIVEVVVIGVFCCCSYQEELLPSCVVEEQPLCVRGRYLLTEKHGRKGMSCSGGCNSEPDKVALNLI
jgi:hypothetical protein